MIHGLLDERITGQRTDDVKAPDIGFILGADGRHGVRVIVGKLDPAGLDELPGRHGAQACDDAIAADGHLAVRCPDDQDTRFPVPVGGRLGPHRGAVIEALDDAVLDGSLYPVAIPFFGLVEIVAAVDDDDLVVRGQRDGVLDGGVPGPDHDDGLVLVFVRVVELILHEGQVFPGHTELAQVALQAGGQHHELGAHDLATGEAHGEVAFCPPDDRDLGPVPHIDAQPCRRLNPHRQHALARAGFEIDGAAQGQDGGLRHHQLAFLIAVDGIGKVWGALQEDVRNPNLGGPRSRAEPRRTGTDDRYLIGSCRHAGDGCCAGFLPVPIGTRWPWRRHDLGVRSARVWRTVDSCSGRYLSGSSRTA